MRFAALATDYDGTLALAGVVAPATVNALERLKASGRALVLVTGRELDELLEIFPAIDRFDRVVAENGALLYTPATRRRKELGQAPPGAFVAELERRGVPFSVGASIVATVHPYETVVLETIRDLGLELQVIFNKGAVMVLPASVNKASGLKVALDELGLSPRNVAAIGDAENDHALLRFAELGVAVANAVPMLCKGADLTSALDHGDAVIELIEHILTDDLRAARPREPRRHVLLGTDAHGAEFRLPPASVSVLVGGPAGSGKSVLAMGILERLRGEGYQYCVIDPVGSYRDLAEAIVFGAAASGPTVGEIMTALEKPDACVVANLSGLSPAERSGFAGELLNRLDALRAASGRPHWILVDDAHQLLPRADHPAQPPPSRSPGGRICVTAHADQVSEEVLRGVDIAVALGTEPEQVFASLRPTTGVTTALPRSPRVERGQAILWDRRNGGQPVRITIAPSAAA
jgi:hypothetical protein